MECINTKSHKNEDRASTVINKGIIIEWTENLTVLDLSGKKIENFDENLVFPPNLLKLNLSLNNLSSIPSALLNLRGLKLLDLSHNRVQFFDDYPNFCHSIEELNLSNNQLEGPPHWVWTEAPAKLVKLDISCNKHLTTSLTSSYLEELLQYTTLVKDVLIYKCRLDINQYLKLLGTFTNARNMEIGFMKLGCLDSNVLCTIPCTGLDQCCDVERLNLSNTEVHSIEPNINMYKNLVEINLSLNKINGIPGNFCDLENLEVCILSNNNIIYLPEGMVRLKKLRCLRLDCNQLCMLPENLCTLPNLKILDLFENSLYEVPHEIQLIQELDLAQNFLQEPETEEYLEKKMKLRANVEDRIDGRKYETSPAASEHSSTTEDEELERYMEQSCTIDSTHMADPPSSPEDWDSEDYWVPGCSFRQRHPRPCQWESFARRMMAAGNFCPMDLHQASVAEMVRYQNMCNPKVWPIVEGQFDDYPGDNSKGLQRKS